MEDPRLAAMGKLVYNVLAGKGFDIVMYDEKGNETESPSDATRLWSEDIKMMVEISLQTNGKSPKPLVTFYTSDVTPAEDWQDVRFTLNRADTDDFSFDVRPFGRTLAARDFKHSNVTEGLAWTGTTRSSYLPVDQVRVVIRHSRPWDRDTMERAQRWRRIRQVMLHTPDGQRFEFPYPHVLGARAMAQHLNQHRRMHDDQGQLIQNLVRLLLDLQPIQRQCRRRQALNLHSEILDTRKKIRGLLSGISQPETYATSIDEARDWSWDWKHQQRSQPQPQEFREERELSAWFEQFDPTRIFEDRSETQQVQDALDVSGGDKYRALDYLKRNVPGWEARFESNPLGVTEELEKIISQLKKSE